MDEMGFIEGQNMAWEYRWAEGHYDRLPALAADLVRGKVDVIVTNGGTPSAIPAKNATSTIPIIFIGVGEPVEVGLVGNPARPGGNITGFSELSVELIPKRVELLCELVPQAAGIGLLVNPNNEASELRLTEASRRHPGLDFRTPRLLTGFFPSWRRLSPPPNGYFRAASSNALISSLRARSRSNSRAASRPSSRRETP
jgi:putative ABC transport system substrate-binding protein